METTAVVDFEVDRSVIELFPAFRIGIVWGRMETPSMDIQSRLEVLRLDAMRSIEPLQVEDLSQDRRIAIWRKAYEAFGVKPKKHRPTHEALISRLLKGGTWPNINPVVDMYLANQVKHILPHGGYDISKLEGRLRLSRTEDREEFEPLGGGEEITEVGELVYRDARSILTRRWNFRDCDRTKITESTTSFLLMIESPVCDEGDASPFGAAADLAGSYSRTFDGKFGFEGLEVSERQRSFRIELS